MATVIWSDLAITDLRKLPRDESRRVNRAVQTLAETGNGDVKKLAGRTNEWRLRVGERRVRYHRVDDTIVVDRVLPRQSAYRD